MLKVTQTVLHGTIEKAVKRLKCEASQPLLLPEKIKRMNK